MLSTKAPTTSINRPFGSTLVPTRSGSAERDWARHWPWQFISSDMRATILRSVLELIVIEKKWKFDLLADYMTRCQVLWACVCNRGNEDDDENGSWSIEGTTWWYWCPGMRSLGHQTLCLCHVHCLFNGSSPLLSCFKAQRMGRETKVIFWTWCLILSLYNRVCTTRSVWDRRHPIHTVKVGVEPRTGRKHTDLFLCRCYISIAAVTGCLVWTSSICQLFHQWSNPGILRMQ